MQLMGFSPDEFSVMPSDFPEDLDKKGTNLTWRMDEGERQGGRDRDMEGSREIDAWQRELQRVGAHVLYSPIHILVGSSLSPSSIPPSLPPSPTCPPAFANPADYAKKNAELKARDVATKLFAAAPGNVDGEKTILVIGSDTMYVPPTERGRERRKEGHEDRRN